MFNCELLDQKVIFQRGRLQRVRRWWSGIHADRGTVVRGWTGWETVEETDRVLLRTFTVTDDQQH